MSQEQDPATRTPISPGELPPFAPTAEVPAVHSDKLNDPDYWTQKYEADPAVVPRKERDDRLDKPKMSKFKKLGLTAAGGLLVGGGAAAYLVSGLTSAAETPAPSDTNTSTTNTGEGSTASPEVEQATSLQPIYLTPDQVAALESTNTTDTDLVWDETVITGLQQAVDGLIENPSLDLSPLTDSADAQRQLHAIADHFSESPQQGQEVYVCPLDRTREVKGIRGACLPSQTSAVFKDSPMSLFVVRSSAEGEDPTEWTTSMLPSVDSEGRLKIISNND